jgi:hypothetical protein
VARFAAAASSLKTTGMGRTRTAPPRWAAEEKGLLLDWSL